MTDKPDRRILRTRVLLRKALLDLIEEKGMERITVKDLTERADINRGTFYLHYRDAADLQEQIKAEIFEGLTKHLSQINPYEVQQYVEKGESYPPSVKVLEYLEQHEDFFRVILGPKGDISFPLQVKKYMTQQLYHNVFNHIPLNKQADVPRDYLIAYVTSAHIGIIMHWFETGRQLSAREVADIITRILHHGPLAATGLKQ